MSYPSYDMNNYFDYIYIIILTILIFIRLFQNRSEFANSIFNFSTSCYVCYYSNLFYSSRDSLGSGSDVRLSKGENNKYL